MYYRLESEPTGFLAVDRIGNPACDSTYCGVRTELFQQSEAIPRAPASAFDNTAVFQTMNPDRWEVYRLAGRRDAHEITLMRGNQRIARYAIR